MPDLVNLAKQLAKELGEGWSGGPGYHNHDAFIHGPNDERLQLLDESWRNRGRGRVYIIGSLRHYDGLSHGVTGGEISVSASRPVDHLARDISRRLLPDYREALEESKRRTAAAEAQEAAWSELERHLLDALSDSHYIEHSHSITSGTYGEDQCDIDVRRSGDYATFQIHVPHTHAVELARFVESLRIRKHHPKVAEGGVS